MTQDDLRLVRGDYSIYRFTDQIYKIVKFKNTRVPVRGLDTEIKHSSEKLDNSLSRSRRLILEKALCNHWSYFGTLEIDPDKYDRFNLPSFYKTFSQWIRDQRKKGFNISYIIVPELHPTSKAWHLHGFFSGLPDLKHFSDLLHSDKRIPLNLLYSDFQYWEEYQNKFGFCSFGKIRSPVRSAFYISKYLTKDHSNLVSSLGAKLFYSSAGLNKPVMHMEVYGSSSYLDEFIQQEYQYCSVGMTKISDGLTWDFALEFDTGHHPLFEDEKPVSGSFFVDVSAINAEYEQLHI